MRLLRELAGFVACLFEAHDFRAEPHRDFVVCHRRWCGEERSRVAQLLEHGP